MVESGKKRTTWPFGCSYFIALWRCFDVAICKFWLRICGLWWNFYCTVDFWGMWVDQVPVDRWDLWSGLLCLAGYVGARG